MTRSFTKQAAALVATCGLASTCVLAQSEVEPNETKATATALTLPAVNTAGVITGSTTGTSTLAGATSLDQFRLTAAAAPLAIYRNTLTITTAGTAGHTGTLRGLNQTSAGAGIPGVAGTTDTTVQTSSTITAPARSNVWYSFGKQEELYYRVTGGTGTTAPYSVDYSVSTVTPVAGPSTVTAGPVTITTIGQTTVDTDLWVYDSNFNAIPLFGCDDETVAGGGAGTTAQSIVTRSLAAGTYYVAISNYNFANNQVSPGDDDFRTGPIFDFPNIAANSSTTSTAQDYDIVIGGTPVAVLGPAASPYNISWVRFTVVPPTSPTNPTGSAGSASANNCGGSTALMTLTVTPGANPVSSGIAVVADLTNIGGSSTQSFVDNGTGGDAFAGDNIFSYTATIPNTVTAGSKTVTYAISDAQSRTGSANGTFNVTSCPATNDECANAIVLSSAGGAFPFTTAGASVSAGFTYCAGSGGDVFFSWTAPTSGTTIMETCGANGDTTLAVFASCAGGASIACNDDASAGSCSGTLQSYFTFSATQGTTYIIGLRNWSGGNPVITGNLNITPASGIDAVSSASPSSVFVSDPLPGGATTSTLLTTVSPAPDSTGLTVVADLSTAGGSSTQALLDNGTSGDGAAGDNVFGFVFDPSVTGTFTFPVISSDAQGRTKNTTITLAVNLGVVDLGSIDTNTDGLLVDDAAVGVGAIRWFKFTTCNEVNAADTEWFDIHTNGSGLADTEIGLYTDAGALVASDDDDGLLAASFLTFGAGSGVLVGDAFGGLSNGNNGAILAAGTYYLAVGDFNMTFNATGFDIVADGLDAGTVDITFDTNLACLPTCGSIDFNGDGLFPDDTDLVEFLTVLAGGDCSPGNTCDTIDFNRDGLFPDDNDLVDFLTVLAGGTPGACIPQ